MGEKVSVIIPARNEIYLEPTIRDVLAKAKGEIEVIAILDGYLPDPQIDLKDDRVIFLHYEKAIGQRPAINEGARRATGKYILKTDAHSMFDEWFDVKLAQDCEYDWTVIPRMYNLDVENWQPKLTKMTDYMFIRSPYAEKKPFRHYYYDGVCKRETPEEYKIHRRWIRNRPLIDDVMTGQGACFFMHKDRYWELGGLDEKHGQWGQMGIEVALKAWLSGGSLKVNKKTWFAHWFRGGGGPGFPWPASGKEQEAARKYSQDLWLNDKWPLQKRPLKWLVNKFHPVPTWDKHRKPTNLIKVPYKETRKVKPWSQEYARSQLKGPIEEFKQATIKSLRKGNDRWFVKVRWLNVKTLFENRLGYSRYNKLEGIRWQIEAIPPFVKRVLDGETFTDKQIKKLDYYKYLVSRLNPLVHPPSGPTRKGVRHCVNQVKDMIKLIYSMRDEGLKAPFDFFITGGPIEVNGQKRDKLVQIRGGRRLSVAYYLGWKKVPCRIWRTEHISERFIPTNKWPDVKNSITKVAAKQFSKYAAKATDKYWRHCYTYYYDKELSDLKTQHHLKILELGVKMGASLKMWQEVFPDAKIYGIDIRPHQMRDCFKHENIKVFRCDEMDTKRLKSIAEKYGPFNLIVDDCNHKPNCQRTAFDTLWPYVFSRKNHGGIYVIEDLWHSYEEQFKKDSIIPHLVNKANNIYTDNEVKGVSFYPNICFITKA